MSKSKVPLTLDQALTVLNKKTKSKFTKKVSTGNILAIPLDRKHFAYAKVVYVPDRNKGKEMLLCVFDYCGKSIEDTGYLNKKYGFYFYSLTKYVKRTKLGVWPVVNNLPIVVSDILPMTYVYRRTKRVYIGNLYLRPYTPKQDDVFIRGRSFFWDDQTQEELKKYFVNNKCSLWLESEKYSRLKQKHLKLLFPDA